MYVTNFNFFFKKYFLKLVNVKVTFLKNRALCLIQLKYYSQQDVPSSLSVIPGVFPCCWNFLPLMPELYN